jgi:hypothetical protein
VLRKVAKKTKRIVNSNNRVRLPTFHHGDKWSINQPKTNVQQLSSGALTLEVMTPWTHISRRATSTSPSVIVSSYFVCGTLESACPHL